MEREKKRDQMTLFKNCDAELRAEECGGHFWGSSDNDLGAFSHQAAPIILNSDHTQEWSSVTMRTGEVSRAT